METFLILHFMFLWAQNEFFFYAVAIPTSNTTNPLKIIAGDSLNITCDVVEDAATVTWFRNGRSVLLITNATSCKFLKINALETYNYSVTCDQQKRFSMAKYGVNSSDDNTTWSCEVFSLNYTNLGTSLGVTVYIYTLTTTDSIPTTTDVSTTSTITTSTLPTTHNDSVQIRVTTIGSNQSMKTATSCLPPDLVIVGVTVSGFLSIIVIIFICCCCPCCCLYHCRMKQTTSNDKENGDNFNESKDRNQNQGHDAVSVNKTKAGIPNKAHAMTNVSRQSSASDKYKDVQYVGGVENESYQSVAL